MSLVLIVLTFFLMLLGAPIFVVIASLTVLLYAGSGIDLSAIIIEMHRMATTPILVAIPLFTFAGYLLAEAKTPFRLASTGPQKPIEINMPTAVGSSPILAPKESRRMNIWIPSESGA